jgi:hypothetical protein
MMNPRTVLLALAGSLVAGGAGLVIGWRWGVLIAGLALSAILLLEPPARRLGQRWSYRRGFNAHNLITKEGERWLCVDRPDQDHAFYRADVRGPGRTRYRYGFATSGQRRVVTEWPEHFKVENPAPGRYRVVWRVYRVDTERLKKGERPRRRDLRRVAKLRDSFREGE